MTLLCGLGLVLREFAREARAGLSLRATVLEMLARLDARLPIGVITCLVAGSALLLTQSRGALVPSAQRSSPSWRR